MSKRAKREIQYRVKNIIEISLFLIVTTWFWYGPRVQMQKRSELLRETYAYMSGLEIKNHNDIILNKENTRGDYSFTIRNNTKDKKDILVTLVMNHNKIKKDKCKMLSYNQVYYYLMREGEEDDTLRTLSMSGNILVSTLNPQEERKYILKYFVEDGIDLEKQHFHGYAILSSGQNL